MKERCVHSPSSVAQFRFHLPHVLLHPLYDRHTLQLLAIGGDMHALDGGDVRDAARLQPIEEFDGGARIGAARVRIADIGDEDSKKR